MSTFNVQLGQRIANSRKRAAVPQHVLARRISLSRASVANIEAGRQVCTAERVVDIANALNIDPVWLLVGKRADEEQAHIIPADAENRFREVVKGVVFGQVEERLRLAWQIYEPVLRRFPVRTEETEEPS